VTVSVVKPDFLFDKVLPHLPPNLDFEKLQLDLRSNNVVQENGWRGFKASPEDLDSQGHHGHKCCVFRPLVNLFNDIVRLASDDNRLLPVLRIQHTPNPTPFSKRTHSSKPDGFLELLERKSVDTEVGTSNWEDIPVSIEFKKIDSDEDKQDVGSNVRLS
jgi:hypothetical protein